MTTPLPLAAAARRMAPSRGALAAATRAALPAATRLGTPPRRRGVASQPSTASPLHLVSLADLTPDEMHSVLATALKFKRLAKGGAAPLPQSLEGKGVALCFSRASTRTRIVCA